MSEGDAPGSRPLVVIPTYNESASLPSVLAALLGLPGALEVLVVDDNSPDGTGGLVRRHAEYGSRVHLLERPAKLGLGSAYKDGFQWALRGGYTAALEMDADLSHDPQDVPRLLAALDGGADIAVGSRYLQGISVVHWPLWRLMLSLGASLYTRLLTRMPMTDPTSGFKAFRRAVIERLDWRRITPEGYGFQIAVHFFARRSGFRVREVPIVFTERREGRSKLSFGITIEAVLLVLRLSLLRLRDAVFGVR